MNCLISLNIFDPDPEVIAKLSRTFEGVCSVKVIHVNRMLYLHPPTGIDVLYLPLAAAERWGAKPLVHRSQVFATSASDQADGLPAFIVTGTCLAPDDPRSPTGELTILLQSVFEAVRDLAASHNFNRLTVGFWAYNLVRVVDSSDVKSILIRIVPELQRN